MDPMTNTPSPEQVFNGLMDGFRHAQAVFAAVALGLPDQLQDGPRHTAELAAATGTNPAALRRLLRYLSALGVLTQPDRDPDMFALTPVGALLGAGNPRRAWAELNAGLYWPAYSALGESLRTGQSGLRHAVGRPVYDIVADCPDLDAAYAAVMTAATSRVATALAQTYDFTQCQVVVDVGGGQGMLLAAVLRAYPHLRGILLDRPAVVAGAPALLTAQGVAERCTVVGGDFFTAVPAGGDVYLIKWVLSDWDDARAVAILRACAQAMRPSGSVLVIDPLEQSTSPASDVDSRAFDLDMLVVWNGGGLRTAERLAELFTAAGLRLVRVTAGPSPFSIAEGRGVDATA